MIAILGKVSARPQCICRDHQWHHSARSFSSFRQDEVASATEKFNKTLTKLRRSASSAGRARLFMISAIPSISMDAAKQARLAALMAAQLQAPAKRISMDEFKEKNKGVLQYDKLDDIAAAAHRAALDRERNEKLEANEKAASSGKKSSSSKKDKKKEKKDKRRSRFLDLAHLSSLVFVETNFLRPFFLFFFFYLIFS